MRKSQLPKKPAPETTQPVDWEGLRDAWSDTHEKWSGDTARFFGVHVPKMNEETIN